MTKPMQQDASELKNATTQEVDNSNTNIPESNQAISSPKTQEDPQPTKQTYKFYTTPNPTEEPMQGYPSKRRGLRNKPVSTNTSYQVLPRQNVTQDSTLSPEIDPKEIQGILDVMPEGHGYVRPKFSPSYGDAYISQSQIRRFNLRAGDYVEGLARPPKERERYHGFLEAKKVNGKSLSDEFLQRRRTRFEELTAIYPNTRLTLEHGKTPLSCRIIDLVSPIGKGQRAMIVSPPKAGKTTVMKDIAFGVTSNFPNVHIIAALIGERPEEVTDIQRNVKGEVIASNFDEPPEEQCRVAEIAIERAKRLVEEGRDVVILLDSITRLARAYNLTVPPSGRTLSGGFDPAALYPPKKFFGAARNCEEGGSLTIIATALVDTGSRMDELIYEEFKGTGNMELHLDRKLAEKRIFPSIDVNKSGTRREELLFSDEVYRNIVTMRRMLSMLGDDERTEVLVERLNKSQSNEEFLNTLKG
jgi:transcription termination factor Rho